jgi:hypothetical protein
MGDLESEDRRGTLAHHSVSPALHTFRGAGPQSGIQSAMSDIQRSVLSMNATCIKSLQMMFMFHSCAVVLRLSYAFFVD